LLLFTFTLSYRRLNEHKDKKRNTKRKRLKDDNELDFPIRAAIPFGEVAQQPPKLTILPQPKLHFVARNPLDEFKEEPSESRLSVQQHQLAIMRAKAQMAYKLAKQAKSRHKGLSDLKADSSRLPTLGKEIPNSICS